MHLPAGSDGDYLVLRANGYLSVVGRSIYEKNGELYGTDRLNEVPNRLHEADNKAFYESIART